jgi:hypothetical protein
MTVLPPSMDHDPRPETIHLNSISESPLTAPDHYQKRISTRYANEMSISASAVAAGVATGCALYQERLSMYRARENALDNSVGSTDSRNSILMPPNRRRKTISLKNSF